MRPFLHTNALNLLLSKIWSYAQENNILKPIWGGGGKDNKVVGEQGMFVVIAG